MDILDERTTKRLVFEAIWASNSARDLAQQSKIKVGAAILTKDKRILSGCNIELKIHKGIHAEVGTLCKALYEGYRKTDFICLVIVYGGKPEEPPYPACAECRQWLWEYAHPDLIIIVAEPGPEGGKITYRGTLKELYPMPYPAFSRQGQDSAGKPASP